MVLLESGGSDANVSSNAAYALMEISRGNADNQKAVVENGGIASLSALIKNSSNGKVKAEVAGALWALSGAATSGSAATTVDGLGGARVVVAGPATRAWATAQRAQR